MSEAASKLAKLRAALAVAEGRAAAAEADLAPARAVVSTSEAIIKALELEIALLKRDKYGRSPERTARLFDQLELQLEELVVDAAEAAAGAEQTAEKTTRVCARSRFTVACHRKACYADSTERCRSGRTGRSRKPLRA